MKKRSIRVNFFYQAANQILTLFIPLITTPYISRVLKAEGIGKFSYTYSVICYLIIFSNLGINEYSSRKMSTIQGDKEKQIELFWQILGTKLINFILPIIVYISIVLSSQRFSRLFLAEFFFLLDGLTNISWYFTGMEDFQSTVKKSFIARIISIVLLFLFVKNENDVIIYALIMGGSLLFSDVLLWIELPNYMRRGHPIFSGYRIHFAGGIKMLMPALAGSVFVYGDKVMLGILLISTMENGYYEQSQKIITLSQGVINAIATVMLPRIASLYSNNNKEMISYYMEKTIYFLVIIGMPIIFGISGIAKGFIPWFFGGGFEKVEVLLYIQSPIVLIYGIYYILGYQYLFGTNQEIKFTRYIMVGSIINIILNYFLIPGGGALGAAVASVISEMVIASSLLLNARSVIHIRKVIEEGAKPLVASILMFGVLVFIGNRQKISLISTMTQIFIGFITYFMIMIILRDAFVIEELRKIKSRIIHR